MLITNCTHPPRVTATLTICKTLSLLPSPSNMGINFYPSPYLLPRSLFSTTQHIQTGTLEGTEQLQTPTCCICPSHGHFTYVIPSFVLRVDAHKSKYLENTIVPSFWAGTQGTRQVNLFLFIRGLSCPRWLHLDFLTTSKYLEYIIVSSCWAGTQGTRQVNLFLFIRRLSCPRSA